MENEIEEKQPRLALAIIMAIVMGLIGAVVFVVLYYIGFIAWIAGLIAVLAAAWGYKKFNLKMDIKGYIIVSVISVVEIMLALLIGLAIDCSTIFEVPFFESFGLLFELMQDYPDLKSAIVSDAIFSLISVVVGIAIFIGSEKRKARIEREQELAKERAKAIEEVNQSSNDDADRYAIPAETDSSETEEVEEDDDDEDEDDQVQPGMEE